MVGEITLAYADSKTCPRTRTRGPDSCQAKRPFARYFSSRDSSGSISNLAPARRRIYAPQPFSCTPRSIRPFPLRGQPLSGMRPTSRHTMGGNFLSDFDGSRRQQPKPPVFESRSRIFEHFMTRGERSEATNPLLQEPEPRRIAPSYLQGTEYMKQLEARYERRSQDCWTKQRTGVWQQVGAAAIISRPADCHHRHIGV